MARGGARRQPRDARGRFSSTGATARGGRIKKASGKRATVTAKAKGAAPSGTIGRRPSKPSKPSAPEARNSIRRTGAGLGAKRPAANNVRRVTLNPVGRAFRGDLAQSKQKIRAYTRRLMRNAKNYNIATQTAKTATGKAKKRAERSQQVAQAAFNRYREPRNAIKPYRPATTGGKIGQLDRQIDSTMKGLANETKKLSETIKRVKPEADKISRRLQRMNAQSIQNRLSKNNADRFVAGVELGAIGSRSGTKAIQRRMQRAADAASRGSKPAARAREIYGNQLAYMGTGKPKAAKNNLRPGPRNKQGPPKRTRKPRKPRK